MPLFYRNEGGAMIETKALGNEGQGGGSGPKEGPKPGIFKTIGNFIGRLFGKSKHAVAGVLTVGAATFEGLAPLVEFGSTVAEIATYARIGLWSLPLMLNGDSGFSANSKPITGAIDIPVTTTADESGPEFEYFYRAMSYNEYSTAGGYLTQRLNDSGMEMGEGPYVTRRLEYAQKASFSFGYSDQYDIIVQYTVPRGTYEMFKNISLPARGTTMRQSEQLGLPIKKREDGDYNFSFYGRNTAIFNSTIIGLPQIISIKK
ncbi:hypothetical protein ACP3T3_07970 [Chryseobacterium sp. CBSDS_008]|uniref:hypothetical protein n=1 Tax=Chryseobacterium sp. CBSDS_008 TaxID=3415265 RepID=UPI003CF83854